MSNCVNYECSDELSDHSLNDCGQGLLAGISDVILLECNHDISDPSNADQITSALADGTAKLVSGVKIGIDQPSPLELPSNIVGGTDTLSTYGRSGTIKDGNVSEANNAFYSTLFSGRQFGALILNMKGTSEGNQGSKIMFIDASVTFTGGLPVKDNNDENMVFNGIFKWRKLAAPEILPAPVGIF